jgi:hypothetical protein
MSKPETRKVKKTREALMERFPQGLFLKIHGSPYQEKGIPDLLCCINGFFFGLEVKEDDDDEPTSSQCHMLKRIRMAGGFSHVVRSPEEAVTFVEGRLKSLER